VAIAEGDYVTVPLEVDEEVEDLTPEQRIRYITELEEKMREAARKFEFEKAAQLRDRVKALKEPGL
jgi:excinuclease ABC subunit B